MQTASTDSGVGHDGTEFSCANDGGAENGVQPPENNNGRNGKARKPLYKRYIEHGVCAGCGKRPPEIKKYCLECRQRICVNSRRRYWLNTRPARIIRQLDIGHISQHAKAIVEELFRIPIPESSKAKLSAQLQLFATSLHSEVTAARTRVEQESKESLARVVQRPKYQRGSDQASQDAQPAEAIVNPEGDGQGVDRGEGIVS